VDVFLLTLVGLGLFVLAVSIILRFILKRPLREIVTDWLAQFF
jgi:hypothetical protein